MKIAETVTTKSHSHKSLVYTDTSSAIRRRSLARTSRGGLDDISPEDILHGEYASGDKDQGTWVDLVYLDGDLLRTFSGSVSPHHPLIEELKILLRPEDIFYLVPIKEIALGFAFKHKNIISIETSSTIEARGKHMPSCVWSIRFKDGSVRTLEAEYQSYFAYGNTHRPTTMTNAYILDKVFASSKRQKG